MTSRNNHRSVLRRLWEEISFSLCKLNQIQFSAPWNSRRPTC